MDENTVVDVTKVIPTSVDEVNQIWVQVQDIATVWGIRVIAAVAILIIGRWVAMLVRRGVRRVMERAKVEPIITGFVSSIAYIALLPLWSSPRSASSASRRPRSSPFWAPPVWRSAWRCRVRWRISPPVS